MTTPQARTWLINFRIETRSRTRINNLCGFFMAGQQDIGHSHHGFRRKRRVKLAF
ncbi:hypothetical protein D3C73_938850 [compost metagenome]